MQAASLTASRFRFCQPCSGLFGPVEIAAFSMNTGSIVFSGDLCADSQTGSSTAQTACWTTRSRKWAAQIRRRLGSRMTKDR